MQGLAPFAGFLLFVGGTYLTAWGIDTSPSRPQAKRVLPGLMALVIALDLMLEPFLRVVEGSVLAVLSAVVLKVAVVYLAYRTLLRGDRAERLRLLGAGTSQ